jgi:ATP-dependent Zn protease
MFALTHNAHIGTPPFRLITLQKNLAYLLFKMNTAMRGRVWIVLIAIICFLYMITSFLKAPGSGERSNIFPVGHNKINSVSSKLNPYCTMFSLQLRFRFNGE